MLGVGAGLVFSLCCFFSVGRPALFRWRSSSLRSGAGLGFAPSVLRSVVRSAACSCRCALGAGLICFFFSLCLFSRRSLVARSGGGLLPPGAGLRLRRSLARSIVQVRGWRGPQLFFFVGPELVRGLLRYGVAAVFLVDLAGGLAWLRSSVAHSAVRSCRWRL